jgi:hypothetical protein
MRRLVTGRTNRGLTGVGLFALALSLFSTSPIRGQGPPLAKPPTAADVAGFREFTAEVQAYLKLQKSVESSLPSLGPTDLPEMIAANQEALARKLREARPHAKPGDLFTAAAKSAFKHAALSAFDGPHAASSRAYMQPGAPKPDLHLAVNEVYPDGAPFTAVSPALLAAFPPLPAEVAYTVVDRTLILLDVKSRLIVDLARLVLPPAS